MLNSRHDQLIRINYSEARFHFWLNPNYSNLKLILTEFLIRMSSN